MNRKFNNSDYIFATVATVSFLLLFSTITNPLFGYDLDDVKSSIPFEEAVDEFDLPVNTKNFSMELDNGLIANYYLAPNQTFVFDDVSGAITEQNDNGDNDKDGDGNKKIKYYVDVSITTTYSYPQSQDKPQDPRNDPKYDSIDWQDDDPDKNLSIEEMDKILEEKEQNNNDNDEGNSDKDNSSNDKDSSGGDSSGGDSSN